MQLTERPSSSLAELGRAPGSNTCDGWLLLRARLQLAPDWGELHDVVWLGTVSVLRSQVPRVITTAGYLIFELISLFVGPFDEVLG